MHSAAVSGTSLTVVVDSPWKARVGSWNVRAELFCPIDPSHVVAVRQAKCSHWRIPNVG